MTSTNQCLLLPQTRQTITWLVVIAQRYLSTGLYNTVRGGKVSHLHRRYTLSSYRKRYSYLVSLLNGNTLLQLLTNTTHHTNDEALRKFVNQYDKNTFATIVNSWIPVHAKIPSLTLSNILSTFDGCITLLGLSIILKINMQYHCSYNMVDHFTSRCPAHYIGGD